MPLPTPRPPAADTPADSHNRVEVTPVSPLTVGGGWKLVAEAGLAGEDPGAKRLTVFEALLGDVQPAHRHPPRGGQRRRG